MYKQIESWWSKKYIKRFIGMDLRAFLVFVAGVILLAILKLLVHYNIVHINFDTSTFISSIILWFTAMVLVQYTYETHLLKTQTIAQNKGNITPILNIIYNEQHYASTEYFYIKNIGKGVALNIQIYVEQFCDNTFHDKEIIFNEKYNSHAYNLGPEDELIIEEDNINTRLKKYIEPNCECHKDGQDVKFAITARYQDITEKQHYTKTIYKVVDNNYRGLPRLLVKYTVFDQIH